MNTKVTTELQAEVISAKLRLGDTASHGEIAEYTGISTNTVRYILSDLPVLKRNLISEREAGTSLKARIVEALSVMPEFKNVNALRRVLGMADNDHDIVHVLHSLHKEGKVDFREDRDGKSPVSIHLTRHAKAALRTEAAAEAAGKAAALDAADVTMPVEELFVEEPTTPFPYPLLAELLVREEQRKTKDANALRYIEAAEILKDIDPESYASLMERADANNVAYPTPLETEYLAYYRASEPDLFPTSNERGTVDDPKES